MDAQLHRERTGCAEHHASWTSLPDAVFVATDRGPAVVVADHLAVWDQHDNTYRGTLSCPTNGTATVLTPPSTVAILRAGHPVQIGASHTAHAHQHSQRRRVFAGAAIVSTGLISTTSSAKTLKRNALNR